MAVKPDKRDEEIKLLRGLLKPFAELADFVPYIGAPIRNDYRTCRLEDCQKAKVALCDDEAVQQ